MTVGTLSLVPKALNGFSLKVNWTTGKLPVVYSRNRDTPANQSHSKTSVQPVTRTPAMGVFREAR
jgi:hypothetical protein